MSRENDPHSQALPPAVRAKKNGRVPLIAGGEYLEDATLEDRRAPQPKPARQPRAAQARRASAPTHGADRGKRGADGAVRVPAYPPDWPEEEDWRHDPRGGIIHTCYGHGRVQRVNQRGSENERMKCCYCRQPWKPEGGRWMRVQV